MAIEWDTPPATEHEKRAREAIEFVIINAKSMDPGILQKRKQHIEMIVDAGLSSVLSHMIRAYYSNKENTTP